MSNPLISPEDLKRIQQYWNSENASAKAVLTAATAGILAWLSRRGFQKIADNLADKAVDWILGKLGLNKVEE